MGAPKFELKTIVLVRKVGAEDKIKTSSLLITLLDVGPHLSKTDRPQILSFLVHIGWHPQANNADSIKVVQR